MTLGGTANMLTGNSREALQNWPGAKPIGLMRRKRVAVHEPVLADFSDHRFQQNILVFSGTFGETLVELGKAMILLQPSLFCGG